MQGLALINGTQLITGLGLEVLHRAELIGKQANVVAALSLESLCGHPGVFDKGTSSENPVASLVPRPPRFFFVVVLLFAFTLFHSRVLL